MTSVPIRAWSRKPKLRAVEIDAVCTVLEHVAIEPIIALLDAQMREPFARHVAIARRKLAIMQEERRI